MSLLINPYSFGAAAPSFNPITLMTWENVYWAEDPDWTNPANGSPVDSWRDASGNARDAIKFSDATRPVYSTTGLNSRPALTFNGAQFLTTAAHTLPGSYSMVWIGKFDSATVTENDNVVTRSGAASLYLNHSSDKMAIYAGESAVITGVANSTNPQICIGYIDTVGNSDAIWVNGTATAAASGNAGADSRATVLGSYFSTSQVESPTGAYGFAGIYNGDIRNDAQFAAFKTGVSGLYGMTIA